MQDDPFPRLPPHIGEGPPPDPPKRLGPFLIWPRHASFSPAPPEVPSELAEDYNEARVIQDLSPKASAALARRCLQGLLRGYANVNPGNLNGEIQQVLDSGTLPSHLKESIDAIRHIGNIAAHPIKDTLTGTITTVEDHEAEWTLDVLEGLFDFYFVQPEATRKKREALEEKLKRTPGNKRLK
ncbi:MAG: DUF4145 domain-containing protein [Anaerolineae bacterium]|nr:DUF4145 domain-containing protein [Anaerolineae bacterium]